MHGANKYHFQSNVIQSIVQEKYKTIISCKLQWFTFCIVEHIVQDMDTNNNKEWVVIVLFYITFNL